MKSRQALYLKLATKMAWDKNPMNGWEYQSKCETASLTFPKPAAEAVNKPAQKQQKK